MSQFGDDNRGPLDPMQKTLTSFVIPGENVSTHVQSSSGLQTSDKHVMLDGELNSSTSDSSCFSNDDSHFSIPHEPYASTESNQLMQPAANSGNDACRINSLDDACPAKYRHSYPKNTKRINNLLYEKEEPLCPQPLWVDDYMCSVCGFELPSSFIEERQEHMDYHLAETLQEKEGYANNKMLFAEQERSVLKARKAADSRKKLKSSHKEDKHIPIDTFFIKCKKNL